MKKFTALMLFLCLTVGVAASLSACKKQTQVDFSAGYQLVFEEGLNDTLKNCVTSFAADMKAALGIELTATVSAGGATEKLEILVGDTDRPESAELKKKIKGDGYAFGIRKDKLVLVGSNKLYTVMALNAFPALLAEGFSLILSFANRWETDFPRPTGEGVSLKGSIDAESNNLLFTYSGDKDDYLAYCQQLETAGESERIVIGGLDDRHCAVIRK